jgi:TldD protein
MKPFELTDDWTRRDFLLSASVGSGALLFSAVSGGCGGGSTLVPPSSPPPIPPSAPKNEKSESNYFSQFGIDEAMLNRLLGVALSKGGTFADLFFQHSITNFIGLQDGEVNRAYSEVALGCGIRVLKGSQTGFAFTEDLTEKALNSAAQTAATVADAPTPSLNTAVSRIVPSAYYGMKVPWETVGLEKRIPLLQAANRRASSADPKIQKVQVYMNDKTSRVLIACSDGRMVEDLQPMTTVYVTCVAEDKGRREENYHSYGRRQGFEFYDEVMMIALADKAVAKTLVLFDATPPPPGEYPVVLAPGTSGILLHEAIGHGMEADFNRKGISVYSEKMGKRIAPDFVTIVDDGTCPSERGSINVDDEGILSARTVLVENGILKSYMHDRISAAHYGVSPTGNGRRESYEFPPVPRMRNTYMMNGPHSPEEIIRSVKKGILAETFTNGQVRIGSGDFSFYLKNGRLIEDGKLTRPVKDANLIGFGPSVLEKVEMVGGDFAMSDGASTCGKDGQGVPVGMGLPTVKCGGISIGGVG